MASTVANTVLTGIGAPGPGARQALLVAEHADLDIAISTLLEAGTCDDLLITRLKKRKLQIKDEIASIAPSSNNDDGAPQEMISCVA